MKTPSEDWPSIWLIAALSLSVHSATTLARWSFMKSIKALSGFLMWTFFSLSWGSDLIGWQWSGWPDPDGSEMKRKMFEWGENEKPIGETMGKRRKKWSVRQRECQRWWRGNGDGLNSRKRTDIYSRSRTLKVFLMTRTDNVFRNLFGTLKIEHVSLRVYGPTDAPS